MAQTLFLKNGWTGSRIGPGADVPTFFPPRVIVEIKALACELPSRLGIPLSRFSYADIAREAERQGIVASISGATVWRWLSTEAIKPWTFRSWIFPRDPQFLAKASPILDLYQGRWQGAPLGPDEYVLSADEKTSLQVRRRIHPGRAAEPHSPRRVEFEYERGGALAYLAAWDVHRAKLFGACVPRTGIEPFHQLVDLVMRQEPYRSARRVFWITDNGSSHRGEPSRQRLREWYPQAVQVHTPVHASWLNQVEIYFSIVQRKLLTPNEFTDLDTLATQRLAFQTYYEKIAQPFEWRFTQEDLKHVLAKIPSEFSPVEKAAA